jgi:hypothetical protein
MPSPRARWLSRNPAPGRYRCRLARSQQRADPRVPPTCRPSAGLALAGPMWKRLRPGRDTPPRGAGTAANVFGHARTRALLLAGRERWHLSVVGSPKTVPVMGLSWGVARHFARPQRAATSTPNLRASEELARSCGTSDIGIVALTPSGTGSWSQVTLEIGQPAKNRQHEATVGGSLCQRKRPPTDGSFWPIPPGRQVCVNVLHSQPWGRARNSQL